MLFDFEKVVKALKAIGLWVYDFVKSLQKPVSPVLLPDEMLGSDFYKIISDYAYNVMDSEVGCDTTNFPKFVYAIFYTKHSVTDEVQTELKAHFTNIFREWAKSYGWCLECYTVCDVLDTLVNIRIYYNDTPEGAAAFANWKHANITREIGIRGCVLEEKEVKHLKKSNAVLIGVDAEKHALGVVSPVYWGKDTPHCILCGPTGSGKSVLAMTIVEQLLKKCADIVICDYKAGGDWNGILPPTRFAVYKDCDRIFDAFYQAFEKARVDGIKTEKYLIFDEMTAWLLDKDSAEYKATIKKLSAIAFLGRSFGFHLLCIAQQPNAQVLPTAIREQLGFKVHMGAISRETANMLFPGAEIDKSKPLDKYCGYVGTPDKGVRILQTARIGDIKKLKDDLIELGKVYLN